jgi:hypothetical protein
MQTAARILSISLLIAGGPSLAHAGTTVISHGFQAGSTMPPVWVFTMAEAILAADGDPSNCGSIGGETPIGTVFSYSPEFGTWDFYCGSATPNGEIALVFDWAEESDSANTGGTQGFAEAAADALYAALRDPWLPGNFEGLDLLASDVHFVGHSRGTVVNSDCVERLAAAGIAVEQVTTLDPHPVDGTLDNPLDWGDRAPITWTNVAFADNYWRADGDAFLQALDFDGMPLDADLDLNLGAAIEAGFDFDPPLEHIEVHAWYHGTIDLLANNDGDGTQIDNESTDTDWYDNGSAGVPARDMTGFFYSSIVGGARPGPISGSDPAWSPHSIYNGDFEIVDDAPNLGIGYAGWRFHGGDKPGIATPWSSLDPPAGSTYYLSLFAGANNESLTHNRLYVDESVGAIELTRRIAFASANDRLQIVLSDGIVEEVLADIDLSAVAPWEIVSFDIPAQSVGLTQALRFAIDGGGDGVEAVVDLDDLHFVPEPHGALLLAAGGAGLFGLARRREARRERGC